MNRVLWSVLATGVILAGCSSDGETASSPVTATSAPAAAVEPEPGTEPSVKLPPSTIGDAIEERRPVLEPLPSPVENQAALVSLLEVTPSFPERAINLRMHDYAFERQSRGFDAYDGPLDDPDAFLEYLSPTGFFRTVSFLDERSLHQLSDWRADMGISLIDVDQIVDASDVGRPLAIMRTTRTPEDIDVAVRANETWGPLLTTTIEGQATIYSWGADYQSNLRMTSDVRPLGVGGHLAVLGDLAIRTHGRPELDPVLAAAGGDGGSLVEAPHAYETVTALLEQGAYLILGTSDIRDRQDPHYLMDADGVVRATVSNGAASVPRGVGPTEDLVRAPVQFLDGFDFVAIGHTAIDGRVDGLAAFHFDTPEQAASNAERLAALVEQGIDVSHRRSLLESLGPPQIGVIGSVLVARFQEGPRDGRGEPRLISLFTSESSLFWRA